MIYGFEGYYYDRLLDFQLTTISKKRALTFQKEKATDGIPVKNAANIVLTVFRQDETGARTYARVDISTACRDGETVLLYIVLSPTPTLFAYTNPNCFGWFPVFEGA
ncbi:MAG: hypothetical protein IJ514_08055 [Clostridia bacterium]|nr:hypothetical protein [Clostridia bacterium]